MAYAPKEQLSGFATHLDKNVSVQLSRPPSETNLSLVLDVNFLDLQGQERLTIGRAENNLVRINDPAVSRYHAIIERLGSRFRINEAWLHSGDQIKIGPQRFVFSGSGVSIAEDAGYTIDAIHINKWGRKDLNLLKDISLDIDENEFVGLVVMSGAEKTTLIGTINGFRLASDGAARAKAQDQPCTTRPPAVTL